MDLLVRSAPRLTVALTLAALLAPVTAAPAPQEEKVEWLLDAEIKKPAEKKKDPKKETGEHQFLHLPFRSEIRVKRYLETGVRRYLTSAGYVEVPDLGKPTLCEATFRPAPLNDLELAVWYKTELNKQAEYCYQKGSGDRIEIVELDLHRYPAGGFELYFLGTMPKPPEDDKKDKSKAVPTTPRVRHTILKSLKESFEKLLGELGSAMLGGPKDDFFLYPLSYIQADRAVAVLKTLGYAVVEYSTTAVDKKTTAAPDKIYSDEGSKLSRPAIINMIDAGTTTLVQQTETDAAAGGASSKPTASVLTGGQRLDDVTDGVPQQQLLIVHDVEDSEALYKLLKVLNEEIDVPARQILIEALVVELTRDTLKDIGFDLMASEDGGTLSAQEENGIVQPLLLEIVRPSPQTLLEFTVRLRALIEEGTANILSRPSVLVLDGRQARIKVGDEVPFTAQVSISGNLSTTATEFLSTGIILNLRPRASADNRQVTFQVETIISSAGPSRVEPGTGILIAPQVQSRQVQTLVRVANDTPFVIGGLIDRSLQEDLSKVPLLSKLPGLGRLFRKKAYIKEDREVIVVVTPHIIEVDDDASSYALPRESAILDNFGSRLFRDSYRLRDSDVFDLEFIQESTEYTELGERIREAVEELALTDIEESPPLDPIEIENEILRRVKKFDPETSITESTVRSLVQVFKKDVPGEKVLVERMLLGLLHYPCLSAVQRTTRQFKARRDPDWAPENQPRRPCNLSSSIPTSNLIFFKSREGEVASLEIGWVEDLIDNCKKKNPNKPVAALEFSAGESAEKRKMGKPPVPTPICLPAGQEEAVYKNDKGDKITLVLEEAGTTPRSRSPLTRVKDTLALERMLDLNPEETFPRTLRAFHTGREVVFPTEEDLGSGQHVVDSETAELAYRTYNYYSAFLSEFNDANDALNEFLCHFEQLLGLPVAKTCTAAKTVPTAQLPVPKPEVVLTVVYDRTGHGAQAETSPNGASDTEGSDPAQDELHRRLVLAFEPKSTAAHKPRQ